MELPFSDAVEIKYLSRLFDNTSESYKFFWFQAILTKVREGRTSFTYNELVDEMVAEAWYMVTEYHLNLGPRDNLEGLVRYIRETSGMKPSEKKQAVLGYLAACGDREVMKKKQVLTKNVPYRLQAPFMKDLRGDAWNVSERELINRIGKEENLIYYLAGFNGMETKVILQPEWYQYLYTNLEFLTGWLQYNLILYLQRRNPSVPGLAEKLSPPAERHLNKVRNYWKVLLQYSPIQEIYGHEPLDGKDIAIDHFVPWSYVAHDELWNLSPTTRSINSQKSNLLPDWDRYFPDFARLEYQSYEAMWRYENVFAEFEKCAKEHLNNDEIRDRLYRRGQDFTGFANALEGVVRPVYQAAQNCGFGNWTYGEGR